MIERINQCDSLPAKPLLALAAVGGIPVRHEFLDEALCGQFADWLNQELEQLEAQHGDFTTARSLISSIR